MTRNSVGSVTAIIALIYTDQQTNMKVYHAMRSQKQQTLLPCAKQVPDSNLDSNSQLSLDDAGLLEAAIVSEPSKPPEAMLLYTYPICPAKVLLWAEILLNSPPNVACSQFLSGHAPLTRECSIVSQSVLATAMSIAKADVDPGQVSGIVGACAGIAAEVLLPQAAVSKRLHQTEHVTRLVLRLRSCLRVS
jgi:hypothetical protein